MAGRISILGLAVLALAAVAMPTAAAASPELVDHEGKVPVDAPIMLTSANLEKTNTMLGPVTCEHVVFTTVVDENSGSSVQAHSGVGNTSSCFASEQVAISVTRPLIALTTTGNHGGTLSMTFIWDIGPFECHYAGTGDFTYQTGTSADELHVESMAITGEEICEPEEGHMELDADFTLMTEETGEPVWFE